MLNERTKTALDEAWCLLDEAYAALDRASQEANIDTSGEIEEINSSIADIMRSIESLKG